jgi:hypothetical protein
MTALPSAAPPVLARTRLAVLVGAVVAMTLAGAVIAAGIVARGVPVETPPPTVSGPFTIGETARTSFGVLAVESAERLKGLTAKDLAGMTHGISGYVPPDKVQVQVSVTMRNLLRDPSRWSPSQFRLVTASRPATASVAKGRTATSSSARPGRLQPDAALDARIAFLVPRDGKKLYLQFREKPTSKPLVFDLGRSSGRKASAAELSTGLFGHQHGGAR